MIHARQRREEQLQRWDENELKVEEKSAGNHVNGDAGRIRRVKFGDSITLLEAAARDDIEEGINDVFCNVGFSELSLS